MRTRKILLVEDDKLVIDACRIYFEERGFVFDACESAGAAVDRLRDAFFDLVITDWFLPDGTGDLVIRFCRDLAPLLPVVVFSNFDEANAQGTVSGADGVVEKSSGMNALTCAVQRCLEGAATRMSRRNVEAPWAAQWLMKRFGLEDSIRKPFLLRLGNRVDWGIAKALVEYWTRGLSVNVIDFRQERDIEHIRIKLFGRASGLAVEGLLADRPTNSVILRNAEYISDTVAAELGESLQSGVFRRVDGNAEHPLTKNLVIVAETPDEGRLSFGTQWIDHVDLRESADDMDMIGSFMSAAIHAIHGIAWESKGQQLPLPDFLTLGMIEHLVERVSHQDDPAQVIAAWTSAMSLSPMRESGTMMSMKEAREQMDRHYLSLLLRSCRGRVVDAVEIAEMGRQRIYQLLKEYDMAASDLR